MVRRKTTHVGIKVKPTPLTKEEKTKLKKALQTVVSILDAHDLTTATLDGFGTKKTVTK